MFVCNETNEVCIVGGEVLSLTPRPNEKLTIHDGEKFHIKVQEYNIRKRDILLEASITDTDSRDRDFSETGIHSYINPLWFEGESINLKQCVFITGFLSDNFRAIDKLGNEISIRKNDSMNTGDQVFLINSPFVDNLVSTINVFSLVSNINGFSSNSSRNPECPLDSEFYSKIMEIALPSLVMDVVDRIEAHGYIEIPVLNSYDFKFCRFNSQGLEYRKTGVFALTKQCSWHEISVRNVASDGILGVNHIGLDLHTSDAVERLFSFDSLIINPPVTNANLITTQKEKASGLFSAVIPALIHYMRSRGF